MKRFIMPALLAAVAALTFQAIAGAATERRIPTKTSATTTPSRERSYPYTFTTSGTVSFRDGQKFCSRGNNNPNYCVIVTHHNACEGFVSIQYQLHNETVSRRRIPLRSDCRYSARITFGDKKQPYFKQRRSSHDVLDVHVRFQGNQYLQPSDAPGARHGRIG